MRACGRPSGRSALPTGVSGPDGRPDGRPYRAVAALVALHGCRHQRAAGLQEPQAARSAPPLTVDVGLDDNVEVYPAEAGGLAGEDISVQNAAWDPAATGSTRCHVTGFAPSINTCPARPPTHLGPSGQGGLPEVLG